MIIGPNQPMYQLKVRCKLATNRHTDHISGTCSAPSLTVLRTDQKLFHPPLCAFMKQNHETAGDTLKIFLSSSSPFSHNIRLHNK